MGKKPVVKENTGVKSRKPRLPGSNSPVDLFKGFRTSDNKIFMKIIMSSRKKVKHAN